MTSRDFTQRMRRLVSGPLFFNSIPLPTMKFDAAARELFFEGTAPEGQNFLLLLAAVPEEEREKRVKDLVRRLRWKGPVFQISALTREGCEPLIRAIYTEGIQPLPRR